MKSLSPAIQKTLIPVLKMTLLVLAVAALSRCTPENKALKPGTWRGLLQLGQQQLPFLLEVSAKADGQLQGYLVNGQEKLLLDSIQVRGDSVFIPLHIFDADLRARINEQQDGLQGAWIRYNLKKPFRVGFTAKWGEKHRFEQDPRPAAFSYDGKWDVEFTDAEGKKEAAVGVFRQQGQHLQGTFLLATGDYRYLDGQVSGRQLQLSTFDGANAYLFTAEPREDGQLQGRFLDGPYGRSTWTARRNEQAALPASDTLTYLKKGYDRLAFTFPNLQSKPVSLSDARYQGKVVVVQLMGTWCPNCMDETAFLAPFYRRNRDRGLEVVGLAYEQSPEFAQAKKRLERLKNRFEIDYELLVAGVRDKEAAAKTLPMLNHVMAFPTTILVDKKGQVRRIHTGFSGPGTGKYYEEFVQDFEKTIDKLLQE
ncbi:MAG: TlpA disulfide reductase family protein [Adhaeribacter sp.]